MLEIVMKISSLKKAANNRTKTKHSCKLNIPAATELIHHFPLNFLFSHLIQLPLFIVTNDRLSLRKSTGMTCVLIVRIY